MIKKLLFSRTGNASFSRRQVFRAMMWTGLVGFVSTVAVIILLLPNIQAAYAWYQDLGTEHYTNTATSTPSLDRETQEKIDRYTDEAYEENQDLFWDYSRGQAIDRMQEELEAEKETLRAKELEGLSLE